MTSIKEIREAIDTGLDKLQIKAEAAAAQLGLTEEDVNARLAEHQEKLKEAATQLQEKLSEGETGEAMAKVQSAYEHLQLQLALGSMEGRDAFSAKKKEIQSAIARFNAELDAAEAAEDQERAAEIDVVVQVYVAEVVALEAELEAIEEQQDNPES